ncbi:MAG: amidohydrolase family protein [Phycisphaerae bacterium]
MPIYDVHTHLGLDLGFFLRGWRPYAAWARDLIEHMNIHGIDRAVCFPFTFPSAFDAVAFADQGRVELLPGRVPFDRENDMLICEIEALELSDRLYPLAMIDPSRCVNEQLNSLEHLAGRIWGLKLQSTIIESPVCNLLTTGRCLLEFAADRQLPVLLHATVWEQAPHAKVSDCFAAAEAFPSIRFDLAHSLGFHAGHLRRAAQMPNVWVDCAALLAHCQLARDNSPIIAAPADRLDADYTRPGQVLEAIHAVLGDRFLWGSDNPFMSWCDDHLRLLYSYAQEAAVLKTLPEGVRTDICTVGPEAWLFGRKGNRP